MCTGNLAGPEDETPPEVALAALVKDDLGVSVDAQALRMFVLLRWEKITGAAHAIHNEERRNGTAKSR